MKGVLRVAGRELIELIRTFPNVKEIRGGPNRIQNGVMGDYFPRYA